MHFGIPTAILAQFKKLTRPLQVPGCGPSLLSRVGHFIILLLFLSDLTCLAQSGPGLWLALTG